MSRFVNVIFSCIYCMSASDVLVLISFFIRRIFQIQSVDKATGVIRVSRKDLLDKSTSVPDVIRFLTSATDTIITTSSKSAMVSGGVVDQSSVQNSNGSIQILDPQEVPVFPKHDGVGAIMAPFPVSPPRAYSKDFFRLVNNAFAFYSYIFENFAMFVAHVTPIVLLLTTTFTDIVVDKFFS